MTANFEGHKLVAVGGSRIGRDTAADVAAGGGSAVIVGQEQARVDETVAAPSKDGLAYGIIADFADRMLVARIQQQHSRYDTCCYGINRRVAGHGSQRSAAQHGGWHRRASYCGGRR